MLIELPHSLRYVADVYTELILRFAKTINSASATLFKAKTSPWATGAARKAVITKEQEDEREEVDTAPKKLEWIMNSELKMAVVSFILDQWYRYLQLT